VLWTVAVVLDFGGLVLGRPTPKLGRSHLSEWAIAGEHLAERYQQFLLITLGVAAVSSANVPRSGYSGWFPAAAPRWKPVVTPV
jgi:low temperature requirement protein LtrA